MKKIICALFALILLALPCLAAAPPELGGIDAPSAVLMHPSGKILFEKDAHARLSPASVTKVMTLLLIFEALESGQIAMDDPVTASRNATAMGGSQVWLKEGEQLTVDEMIKCIVVASANDCSVAMAELIAGTEEAFVDLMNRRAQELGMADTSFQNCHGLEAEGHYTSAYDIALMSAALLRHRGIQAYTTIWMDSIRDGQSMLVNTNKLLRSFDGVTGLKTGSTSAAGYCLSATAERDGLELIAVILKAPSTDQRFADATSMLNYGYAHYAAVNVLPDRPIMPMPVVLGKQEAVACQLAEAEAMLLLKSQVASLEKTVTMDQNVRAPVEKGQKVGTLVLSAEGEFLAEIPIVTSDAVERMNVFEIFRVVLKNVCMR